MKQRLLFLLLAASPLFASGQFQPTGALTVFSEDGDKFYLILNGERQNDVAQTNVRIEDLPQPYYKAKIIFEDKSIAEISKNAMVADADGAMMDVTYRLKKGKDGKAAMRGYSVIPMAQNFAPPPGMYVRRFGQPANTAVIAGPDGMVQQVTTVTTGGTDVRYNANVGGVNMNVTVNDPAVSHTTTTTTTTSRSGYVAETSTAGGCGYPMSGSDFSSAKGSINETSFDETRVSTAKSVIDANCMSAEQIAAVCRLMSFEASKLDFAKYAYAHCTDPRNYFKINSVFSFDASKQELNSFISGH